MSIDYGNFIGYYVQNLSKRFTHRHNTMLEQIGLTYSQFRILSCLWERDARTQNCILKDTLIKPASLTGILATLERKGYITKEKKDEDGRSRVVCLTEAGRALEKPSFDIILDLENQVREGVAKEALPGLISELEKLLTYTEGLSIPPLPESAKALLKNQSK